MVVKQPQILQRRPVWCSQGAQVCNRFCTVSADAGLNPEPAKWAIDFMAEKAIRNNPGPLPPGAAPGKVADSIQPLVQPKGVLGCLCRSDYSVFFTLEIWSRLDTFMEMI